MVKLRVAVIFLGLLASFVLQAPANAKKNTKNTASKMVFIPAGTLKPFYPVDPDESVLPIKGFYADVYPVTNEQFLQFVKKHPQWRRDRVSELFVDKSYLSHWEGPQSLGHSTLSSQPVTHVSWFAAKAYCEAQKKRLPDENEWEYMASASNTKKDGRSEKAWRQQVLDWYSQPNRVLKSVGSNQANFYGVHDLHGLIWEWVMDFNSSLLSSDNRNAGDDLKNRFCGAGALAASEKEDYPSFMRLAFRSSLQAKYTTSNLGFRCVKSL